MHSSASGYGETKYVNDGKEKRIALTPISGQYCLRTNKIIAMNINTLREGLWASMDLSTTAEKRHLLSTLDRKTSFARHF